MDRQVCGLVHGQKLYLFYCKIFTTTRWIHKNDAIKEGLESTFSGRNDLKSLGDLLGQEQPHNLLVCYKEEDLGAIRCPDPHL